MKSLNPWRGFPPLNALRVFEVAARHLNFRSASEELGATQGAVAQQIRGLEAALSVKLFRRLPRGLALTEEGRRYLPPIRQALKLILAATQELRPQQATLSISVTPTFATRWLVPRLGAFTTSNPDLDVRLVATEGLANFQSDGVDIAVRQGKPPFGPGLTATLLYPIEIFAVCSPELMKGAAPLQALEDLRHHVLLHDAHGYWPLFLQQAFADKLPEITRRMKFNQTAHAIDAALAGQGVALTSAPLVATELAAGRLCRPFDLTLPLDAGFYVVAPRAPRQPEPVARMRAWLTAQSRPPGTSPAA